jgi:hypothetical protein
MYCPLGARRRWIEAGHRGVVLSILSTSTDTGRAFTVPSAMAKSALLAMTIGCAPVQNSVTAFPKDISRLSFDEADRAIFQSQ